MVKPNEHQIDDLKLLAKEIGVDEVILKTAQVYDYKYGNELIPDNEKYSRYKKHSDGTYSIKNSLENNDLIEANIEKPIIIDFYYDFYLYLIKEGKEEEAFKILNALNNKQNEFKAFVYSPFVESELSRLLKKQNNFQDAVNYLVLALEHAKNIKPEDEVKLYYDILTLYDSLGQKEQKEIYLQKCKNINIEDNFYKTYIKNESLPQLFSNYNFLFNSWFVSSAIYKIYTRSFYVNILLIAISFI